MSGRGAIAILLFAAATGFSGCASQSPSASVSDAGTDSAGAASASGDCPITASDAWAKTADSGMTAAFGNLVNEGSQQVTVISASSPAAARVEIHEVVDKDGAMVMQPMSGGLVIAGGASRQLAPGADHLMLMDIGEPIKAGQDVSITLACSGGGTATITAQAKTFTGAQEQYQGSSSSPSAG